MSLVGISAGLDQSISPETACVSLLNAKRLLHPRRNREPVVLTVVERRSELEVTLDLN